MSENRPLRLTRRGALLSGLGASAGALLGGRATGAGPPTAMITKAIPATGEKLPVIGLGTDKFRDADQDAITAEIRRMQQLGGTVIDTAAAYGDSEAMIGQALGTGLRDHLFLATKLTASGSGYFGRGVAGAASFERSLALLKTQRVDLLQVHNLDGVDELMPQLQQWKQAGRIRYIGITTSRVAQHEQMLGFMQRHPLDFIQIDYSIDNRDAARKVLPLAAQRRIAVLANIPFGFGAVLRQAQTRRLPLWAADIDVTTWGQFLLKYVVSHPAVTSAIPGSTQVAHLEDNQGAGRGRLPDEAMRRKMEEFWDTGRT
jgi:aryl-alcohol dehydrogenase-like predicted oxidoreductase